MSMRKLKITALSCFKISQRRNEFAIGLIPRLALFVLCAMFATVAVSCTSTGGSGEKIIIAGSTSVMPYMEELVEEYERLTGAVVDVQGGGSSAGLQALAEGAADVAMSSRNLKGDEVNYYSKTIAKDVLVVITHPDNPIRNLTLQQIRDIYNGTITDWKDLPGGIAGEIYVISREDGSGTRAFFEEIVMINCANACNQSACMGRKAEKKDDDCEKGNCGCACVRVTPRAIIQNANGSIRTLVAGSRQAIGFISLEFVDMPGQPEVIGLQIDGAEPTVVNINNGSYTLARPFIIAMEHEHPAQIDDFIAFILSNDGQEILEGHGLVRGPDASGGAYRQ